MAVSRLSQQSLQNAFPKGNTIWDNTTSVAQFDCLGAVYVSSAASITFSNIPQTYTHLHIRSSIQVSSGNEYVKVQFNGDTATNYTENHLFGNGTNAGAGGNLNYANVGLLWSMGAPSTANVFGASVADILDYTNTNKHKTLKSLDGVDLGGSGGVCFMSGAWVKTGSGTTSNAITSITFTPNSSVNFASGTRIALYGVK